MVAVPYLKYRLEYDYSMVSDLEKVFQKACDDQWAWLTFLRDIVTSEWSWQKYDFQLFKNLEKCKKCWKDTGLWFVAKNYYARVLEL